MGLYDRDYMRDRPAGPDIDEPGLGRTAIRRKWLMWIGVLLAVAAVLAMVILSR